MQHQLTSVNGGIADFPDETAPLEQVEAVLAEVADLRIAHDAADDATRANQIRARHALTALAAFADVVCSNRNGEPVGTLMSDLINDLHHLADLAGVDWDQVNDPTHYLEEIGGEV
ncbi:hypothetical protein SEA_MORGANA_167 [Gordonia phage Morgana]|uniref:MazG-like nucleotide pyrophosphohydrolase n=1 Tax=Gordonia phage Morgana TaxID=3137292 RepID=A0AAX4RC15_9CAUD